MPELEDVAVRTGVTLNDVVLSAVCGALRSGQPLATFALLQACGAGPHALTELVFRLFESKVRAVITNVPGPVRRLSLCGAEISGIAFWVPTARTGLGIGIVSYADTVRIGVEADARLVDDPEPIVRAFEDELRTLTTGAGRHAIASRGRSA